MNFKIKKMVRIDYSNIISTTAEIRVFEPILRTFKEIN